jgi:hypothetical protein
MGQRIARYRWDWGYLSKNKALPWSKALVERYADRWDWEALSRNEGVYDSLAPHITPAVIRRVFEEE